MPINEAEAKQKFFETKNNINYNDPVFKYSELDYHPKDFEISISKINIPKSSMLESIYKDIINRLLLQNMIIENRGNNEVVREISTKLYGVSSKEYIKFCEKFLKDYKFENENKDKKEISVDEVKRKLYENLIDYRIGYWNILISDTLSANADRGSKIINLPINKKYYKSDIKRLKVHEIDVHVIRDVNSESQPLSIFRRGLPGYIVTEEGLTSYTQKLNGCFDQNILKNYALNYLAVDSVIKGYNMKHTYERLKEFGVDDKTVWSRIMRSYRGGGYTKDKVYLEGYMKVSNSSLTVDDLKTLYVGKVGIEHLHLVNDLSKLGLVNKPKIVPDYLNNKMIIKL